MMTLTDISYKITLKAMVQKYLSRVHYYSDLKITKLHVELTCKSQTLQPLQNFQYIKLLKSELQNDF